MDEARDRDAAPSAQAGGQAGAAAPRRRPDGSLDFADPATQRYLHARRAAINAERRAAGKPALGTEARRAAAQREREATARALARAQARPPRGARPLTAARRKAFLEALAETGNAVQAARQAGCHVSTARRLADRDPEFAAAWVEAMRTWRDMLDGALREAAIRAYGTLAANGGFGKRPAVSERMALWLVQGGAPDGRTAIEPRAAPHLGGIDGEAEEAELERLLEELARKMGSPFAAPAPAAPAAGGPAGPAEVPATVGAGHAGEAAGEGEPGGAAAVGGAGRPGATAAMEQDAAAAGRAAG